MICIRRLTRSVLAGLCLFTVAQPALAACYSEADAEADRGIRLHSELMVIGLTCRVYGTKVNTMTQYGNFSNQNHALLKAYESRMIRYFAGRGGNGESAFNKWRTSAANDVTLKAARMTPVTFCLTHMRDLEKATTLSADQVKTIVQQQSAALPKPANGCRSPEAIAKIMAGETGAVVAAR